MKQTIRLRESELRRMISESVKRILKEDRIDPTGQWNTQDDFFDEKALGKKIWDLMYKYQKSGNPNLLSKVSNLLYDTFDDIEFSITCPNMPQGCGIKAYDTNGNFIAELNFEGNTIHLYKIQEFLDKINKF